MIDGHVRYKKKIIKKDKNWHLMNVLLKLLSKLGIDKEHLIIVNEITGAGYIMKDDNVFARWGYIQEGIAILEAYLEAAAMPNIDA